MCGILFTKNIELEEFKGALEELHHRGPDATGIEQFGNVILGHKRLAILDLDDRSSQPFLASNGTTYIIFNGEIYNYKALKQQFNITTRTSSDTEVLVELYLLLGKEMLEHLNGMFSFVIYDIATKDMFIARDRLGIKPLYVYENGDCFICSSEISAILAIVKEREYDLIGIRQYLKLRTFFRGHTLYENIKMFPAGYFQHNSTRSQYWNLEDYYSTSVNEEELKQLITSAIDLRKVADVETGSYLSGGVDSSIIAAYANKEHTWTVGFESFNEFEFAQLVADKYNFKHHEISISRTEFKGVADAMIRHKKEPLSVPNEVSLYKMTRAVAHHNTVVLSGEGADELFFGYDRIFRWAAENEFSLEQFDKYYSYGSHKDDEIINYVLEPVAHISDNLLKIATFFQLYHLHGLLRRLDSSTMLCSVEARVPFVDHRLVEYLYGVSSEFKMKEGIVKEPLKRLFSDIIPAEVLERKKIGFPVPLEDIFSDSSTGMDGWLEFNIEKVLQGDWLIIKKRLEDQDVYI